MDAPDPMTYPPLGRLKTLAPDLWLVDGPVIRFGPPWPKMPFSTRMSVIRLKGEGLFVHSPTPLTESLKAEIEALGTVRWIIGPNRLHYSWIPDWRRHYPMAEVYLAPRIAEQSKGRIDFSTRPLDAKHGFPWDDELATLPVPGGFMTEVDFFHLASRTLILTDLIENFERHKLASRFHRQLASWGGVLDPDGSMPRDLRFTFRHFRHELRDAVETMIAWEPRRIILAHGRCYEGDGAAELRRAFRWVLKPA